MASTDARSFIAFIIGPPLIGVILIFWAITTAQTTFTVAVGGGLKGTVVVGNYVCTSGGKTQTCDQYGNFTGVDGTKVKDAVMFGFPNDVTKGQHLPAVYVARTEPGNVYAPGDKGDFIWTIVRFLTGAALLIGSLVFDAMMYDRWRRRRRGEVVPEFGEVPERRAMAENVILHARVNDWDWQTHRGQQMATIGLTDDGHHVTWHDGRGQHVWRLPDQSAPGVPVLSRVVLLTWGQYQTSLKKPSTTLERLVLVDDHENVLASVITTHFLTQDDMGRFWPESQFADLEKHGVTYSHETYDDVAEIPKHYKGAVSKVRVGLFSHRGALRAAVILGISGAIALTLLTVWYVRTH